MTYDFSGIPGNDFSGIPGNEPTLNKIFIFRSMEENTEELEDPCLSKVHWIHMDQA